MALEFGLRALLFGEAAWFAPQRRAGKYADYFGEDDYWLLQSRLDRTFEPPPQPHPVLGWTGRFSGDSYLHGHAKWLRDRRPVLLYGDSFAACVPGATCFEELLDEDPHFAADLGLLNYGVGGYGLGQIRLLIQHSLELYEDPFVIVSLMTYDLDRTLLSVRTGQKPRFSLTDGELVVTSPPIEPDGRAFFDAHPPRIRSYLLRRLLFSGSCPDWLRRAVLGDDALRREKLAVNEALLDAILADLEQRGLDYHFVVFHARLTGAPRSPEDEDWRERFLRGWLEQHGVPYTWSADLAEADLAARGLEPALAHYNLPGNGHPNEYFNRLVASALSEIVLSAR